ncbi:MAG: TetR/AcrR family transcriptional regulator [Solirubrobacteraceae bacterium]|nr:TetR/AcrR family transcriptional regulator [Solirubrobacteraceae bacterium]
MAIPAPVGPWTSLTADEKRARILAAADELFAREGVDAAMPVLADALGVGVASIYRQVGSKDDLVGRLVIARATALAERFRTAAARPDAWGALVEATHATVDDCIDDALSQSAWDAAAGDSDAVRDARAAATDALEGLVGSARRAGALRPDATHEDLRLLFCALREVAGIGRDGAHRMAELVLRGIGRPDCDRAGATTGAPGCSTVRA